VIDQKPSSDPIWNTAKHTAHASAVMYANKKIGHR
jgi:hypothetical protein